MARPCTICSHARREAIDHDLVAGRPLRALETTYGVSRTALARHKEGHLAEALARAAEARREADERHGASLLEQLDEDFRELRSLAREARAAGNRRDAISAYRAAAAHAEALVKLEGHARPSADATGEDAERLKHALLVALEAHPEARAAAARAMLELESRDE